MFFFSPSVAGVVNDRCLLSLSEVGTPCDRLLERRPWKPCGHHGPFRCSCLVVAHLARAVFQLERELMLLQGKLEVLTNPAVDCCSVPFFQVDFTHRTASLFLHGLPVPQRCYGPFPLTVVDDSSSFGRAVADAFSGAGLIVEERLSCVLCAANTGDKCCVCKCVVCGACGAQCRSCVMRACRACIAVSNEFLADEGVYCFACYCP
ncbi:hypothetical protein DQ04_08041020 [Trypanosoma grayi]|uniref:hypothetical protein n=1 Tax=Trypanosoma grayi TaxID=71804 RepID=UPI0004F402E5|nr:hypothetical protein DQ04_08041020 [Trypanosoma grayi]KEG08084.1 hypothetical protein DQ04_08041020 [Trypanosoma grayi]